MVKKKKALPNKKKGKSKSRTEKILKDALKWAILFILFIIILSSLVFVFLFRNRIYPHVLVGKIDLSGKTQEQAAQILALKYQNISTQQFRLGFADKEWVFHGADWGVAIDIAKTVSKAYAVGRKPQIWKDILTFWQLQKNKIIIPLEISFDETNFSTSLEQMTNDINIPLIEASIIVDKNQVKLNPATEGREIDKQALQQKIVQALTENNSYNIVIPVRTLAPKTTKEEEEVTLKRGNSLLKKQLKLIIGEDNYSLENQELISLISFNNSFNTDKIASIAANLSEAFDKDPQNAAFKFESGRVTVFKPGKNGQKLDREKAVGVIFDGLTSIEATSSSKLILKLPVVTTAPETSTSEVNDLGIKELLGKGISYFKGSIASRIHNIVLASSKLNGILIKPGETFSFNDAVGDISQATGFQQAYVIQNGRTVLGDGGGVCQVSTTLFRAALNSGLPIVERQAHAYRVGYYEQGFGPGLDATVFAPSVDLKIKNDTPAHILIQTYSDPSSSTLVFELYGTSDGRVAYVSTPRVWDQTPPPPPKYEDDPTLPVGQEKQVDFAAWGAKSSFDYKVTRNGETLINKTFYSNFRPWQAVYLRGTKT